MDTGMTRRIDDLGRIVIPAETRRLFGIHDGDMLSIGIDGSTIVIRKLEAVCIFCENPADTTFRDRGVCQSCLDELTKAS